MLIFTGNAVFYTLETMPYYIAMTLTGIAISVIVNALRFNQEIQPTNYIVWLTVIYSLFFLYGLFFLRAGSFDWDGMLVRFAENFALYLAIKGLLNERNGHVLTPFLISGVISAVYIVVRERSDIISGGIRIGSSLSGNVNNVGFNFGFVALLVTWYYCKTKKKVYLFILMAFAIIMLLTGSKKAILILAMNLLMIFIYQKDRIGTWLKLGIAVAAGFYFVFKVPYLYDILGVRIETMIATVMGRKMTSLYSYSTDMRKEMMKEAFGMFLNKPILGGGYNYFRANTVTQYEYSHCNYTELLCSFGIVGTMVYYSKLFSNSLYILTTKLHRNIKYKDIGIICLILVVEMLVVDIATITFAGQSIGYMPIIFSSAALDFVRMKRAFGLSCETEN
ncbi:MAG: O-antigen ligase family protein [Oscillospiraceae bacterium]|nr:O-antigen ligase family protein [Oscillospiraceae bacterium]